VVWGVIYFVAGAVVVRYGGVIRFVLVAVAVAAVVAGIVLVRINERRLTAVAEREMPGPLDFGGLHRREDGP